MNMQISIRQIYQVSITETKQTASKKDMAFCVSCGNL